MYATFGSTNCEEAVQLHHPSLSWILTRTKARYLQKVFKDIQQSIFTITSLLKPIKSSTKFKTSYKKSSLEYKTELRRQEDRNWLQT